MDRKVDEELMAELFPGKENKWAEWLGLLHKEEVSQVSDLHEYEEADWAALGLPRTIIVKLRGLVKAPGTSALYRVDVEYDHKRFTRLVFVVLFLLHPLSTTENQGTVIPCV